VAAGRFREDLFYRLSVIPLVVPPLRERVGDVQELCDHFLSQAANRVGRAGCRLSDNALALLTAYSWPGNVRELQNLVTRAVVLGTGDVIEADDLRPWLIESGEGTDAAGNQAVPIGVSLQEMERRLIEATLERFAGHRAKTAQALGIGLRTLTTKLKEYGHTARPRRFGGGRVMRNTTTCSSPSRRAETAVADAPKSPTPSRAAAANLAVRAAGATVPAARIAGRRNRLRIAHRRAACPWRRQAARRVHFTTLTTRSSSSC
jgi:hypothetical protein